MAQFKNIPKGCGSCSNEWLELYKLKVRCLKCGWTKDLTSLFDFINSKNKKRPK